MKFKMLETSKQNPFFTLSVRIEGEQNIGLGPFVNEKEYELKRYLRLLKEMKKQDQSVDYHYGDEYEMIPYFRSLLLSQWKYDPKNNHKEKKLMGYEVYYHDEEGRKCLVEIENDEKEGYYYLIKNTAQELNLHLHQGDFLVTDQPLSQEKQNALHADLITDPFSFLEKYVHKEEEIEYNVVRYTRDETYVMKVLKVDMEMNEEEYNEYLADLNMLFLCK